MSRRIKKEMRDNQKEEKKDFKKEHNKKAKCDNLDSSQIKLRKYIKKISDTS